MLCRSPGARAGWGSQGPCTGLELLYLLDAVVNLFIVEGKEAISAAVKMVFLTLTRVVSHIELSKV